MPPSQVFINPENIKAALEYCLDLWGKPGVVSYYEESWVDKLLKFFTQKKVQNDRASKIERAFILGGRWGQSWYHDLEVHLEKDRGPLLQCCFVFNKPADALMFKLAWGGNI